MGDRRSISEGLRATPSTPAVDPAVAREFIHGGAGKPAASGEGTTPTNASSTLTRVPISTRIREDFARALKRASLQRQLEGREPNTLQDILEEAIEPWLRNNKYFP
jgi:hypothetical protein